MIVLIQYGVFAQVISEDTEIFSSNLPLMFITTNGQQIVDTPKITAQMGIIYNGEGQMNSTQDSYNEYDGYIGIELRGNSTQGFPKKPYVFETRDALGENLNVSLLGMPEENDWILRASYIDHTFIRNGLANYMSRQAGNWASRTKHVELFLNNEYQGIYVLMEKIKVDKNRLDIAKLSPDEVTGEDLTGGYIWEISGFKNDFESNRGLIYPAADVIARAQRQYIQNYDDEFRDLMNQSPSIYSDPETGYPTHINVASFIYELIVQEAMRNSDAYGWSGYFHKDKNDVIHAGPVWDFDQSAGNSSYPDNGVVEIWMASHPSTNNTPPFWPILLNDPFFKYSLKLRWEELRVDKLSTDHLLAYIDSIATELLPASNREFAKWPVLGQDIYRETIGYQDRDSYQKEVDYMKEFLKQRWAWIDQQLQAVRKPSGYPEITFMQPENRNLDIQQKKYYINFHDHFKYSLSSKLEFEAYAINQEIVNVYVKKSDSLKIEPKGLGNTYIVVSAIDTYGNKTTLQFSVTVYDSEVLSSFSVKQPYETLVIYPNPADDRFNLKLPKGQENGELVIRIFNCDGKSVYERKTNFNNNEVTISGEFLSTGVYLVMVQSNSGEVYKSRLKIQK